MSDVVNAGIAGASAGAVLGLGWIGAAAFALLNAALAAKAHGVDLPDGKTKPDHDAHVQCREDYLDWLSDQSR